MDINAIHIPKSRILQHAKYYGNDLRNQAVTDSATREADYWNEESVREACNGSDKELDILLTKQIVCQTCVTMFEWAHRRNIAIRWGLKGSVNIARVYIERADEIIAISCGWFGVDFFIPCAATTGRIKNAIRKIRKFGRIENTHHCSYTYHFSSPYSEAEGNALAAVLDACLE